MPTHKRIGENMKRYGLGLVVGALGLSIASVAMGYSAEYVPGAGINGTPHDLGTPGANGMNYAADPADPLRRICIFCHAPHLTYRLAGTVGGGIEAPPEYDYLPLWNHRLPDVSVAYTMYDNGPGAPQTGPTASQAILQGMTPGSTSLLCLSCHDGSLAVNAYGTGAAQTGCPTASNGTDLISPCYRIGEFGYLGNHHPIGFNYDSVQSADPDTGGGIRPADGAMLTPTTFVRDHLYGDARMECGTCHAVHNAGNTGERLLWRSDQNSELCLTCHAKGMYRAP